jgi:chromosome segregation ATPase
MGERTTIEFDEDLKQAIDEHDMTMRDIVHKGVRGLLGQADLEEEYLLKARIEELEQEISHWESKEQEAYEKKESKLQELDILQMKLAETREEANTYEDDLDAILDDMVDNGMNVFEDHPAVKDIARSHNHDPEEVITDLRARADTRVLGLDKTRFVEQTAAEYSTPEAQGGAF